MTLKMPHPWRHPTTGTYYLRERVPADLQTRASGRLLVFSIDGVDTSVRVGREHVKVSLRTKDEARAKLHYRLAAGTLTAFWASLRTGPRVLSGKEVAALAGEAYRELIREHEQDPGGEVGWEEGQGSIDEALELMEGRSDGPFADPVKGLRALAELVSIDVFLSRRALELEASSRDELLIEVAHAHRQAMAVLERNARGDYSPDPQAGRFPSFPEVKADTKAVSLLDLFDGYARERKPAQATVEQWRRHVQAFIVFMQADDAGQVSKADVVRWKDSLVAAGGSPKTINESKLAALRVTFGWGVRNVRVAENPASGVSVAHKARLGDRMLGFTDEEAATILKAAAQSTRPAIRWLPLLCATSGARVGEMAQLRREDVIVQEGITCLRITDEAGSVKNANAERVIPLHPEVIRQGFLAFVEGRTGPLFYDAGRRKAGAKKPPQKIVAKNVAAWVAGLGLEVGRAARKDPNHAWRHRFKTLARAAGVNDSVADAIVGHAPDTVAKAYGGVTLGTMAEALGRMACVPPDVTQA